MRAATGCSVSDLSDVIAAPLDVMRVVRVLRGVHFDSCASCESCESSEYVNCSISVDIGMPFR